MSKYVGLKRGRVHEEHILSEYYCGGCGWPVTDHDSYCPECGGTLHENTDNGMPSTDAPAVRFAEKLQGIAKEMRNVGASSMKPHELLACYAAEVDKVANLLKLTSTLENERTCQIVKTWSDSDYVDGWNYRCSECCCFIPVNERNPDTGDVISAANYCPNCGARVIKGD